MDIPNFSRISICLFYQVHCPTLRVVHATVSNDPLLVAEMSHLTVEHQRHTMPESVRSPILKYPGNRATRIGMR